MSDQKHNPLFVKADLFAKEVYKITQNFPKHEQFGLTSQLRRAGLSVVLNVVEGFARNSNKEFRRFLFISYGSLKESKYLLNFSVEQKYLSDKECLVAKNLAEETAKIIWSIVKN